MKMENSIFEYFNVQCLFDLRRTDGSMSCVLFQCSPGNSRRRYTKTESRKPQDHPSPFENLQRCQLGFSWVFLVYSSKMHLYMTAATILPQVNLEPLVLYVATHCLEEVHDSGENHQENATSWAQSQHFG